MNRREFMQATAAGVAVSSFVGAAAQGQPTRPVAISSANGMPATAKAVAMLGEGADTLDAVVAGVNIVEADPEDTTVGYGGLPNENGVVQLDSCVMHGRTRGAGAVACLEHIKHPSKVAQLVMERTDHVILVGEGALQFALAMGFEKENLLTDAARERWMEWKRSLSDQDDWIEPEERLPRGMREADKATAKAITRSTGTIHCSAIDTNGDLSAVTTTSGLAFKIPGRVGDSPIIGAGCYVDNNVGACGCTGRGEAVIKTCASFLCVEFMRGGLPPEEAALKAAQRIAENTVEPYLLREDGKPAFDVKLYALNKKGEVAGVALWSGAEFAHHDGVENKLRDCAYLFER
jgi:N4-(beta-N-acetylglucosaminyl)-L-asparaginase